MRKESFARRTAFIVGMVVCVSACVFAQSVEDQARDYYRTGNLLYQQGRFREAQEQYQKALDILKNSEQRLLSKRKDTPATAALKKGESATPEQKRKFGEYTVGEDDVLAIAVWQNEDLNQEAIVRPDGMISFPLIGDVEAKGLTIPQLDQEITGRLKEFVRFPEVSISLKKVGGSRVIVLGEINSPGVYNVAGTKTVLEAIGQAGGFTTHAVPSSIILIRGGLANPKAERINLSKALHGKDVTRQNVVLQATDIVFVPKKFVANVNYFLGQILDPISRGIYTADQLHDW